MSKPKYQAIVNNQKGRYEIPDNGGIVDIVAGDFEGVKSPAFTFTPIEMYNIRINNDKSVQFNLPESYNTGILVLEGQMNVNQTEIVTADKFILFKNEGETIYIESLDNSILLVLSGQAINEPIVAYGSFLMNIKAEIMQAYDDVNNGKFGFLEN